MRNENITTSAARDAGQPKQFDLQSHIANQMQGQGNRGRGSVLRRALRNQARRGYATLPSGFGRSITSVMLIGGAL